MVEKGEFRKDLLYRVRSLVISLPPLRERRDDIKDLVLYHMARFCERNGLATKGFSSDFFEVLSTYDWPGNVRELVNAIERSITVGQKDQTLYPKHLPPYIRVHAAKEAINKVEAVPNAENPVFPLPPLSRLRKEAMDKLEHQYLLDALLYAKGDIETACRMAGLQRTRFYQLLKKYGISASRLTGSSQE
jgi:two-component system NtrC family response regulator